MIIKNSVKEGYTLNKGYWFPQGVFSLIYSMIVGLLILPFAFFVAITATILGENNANEFTWESALFWFSIVLLTYASTVFMAMLMGTLQFRAFEKEQNRSVSFEDGIKHPFVKNRFKSYLIFSMYFFLLLAILGLFSWGISEVSGLNDNNSFGFGDAILIVIELILLFTILSAANFSVMAIANDEASSDAFVIGWRKFINTISDLFSINFIAAIPIAFAITATALTGILISFVSPPGNQDPSAGELTLILILTLVIIFIQLIMVFFILPLYASIVTIGNENAKSKETHT